MDPCEHEERDKLRIEDQVIVLHSVAHVSILTAALFMVILVLMRLSNRSVINSRLLLDLRACATVVIGID